MTTIRVTLHDLALPENQRDHLATVFKTAVLRYCKDADRLREWRDAHDHRFNDAKSAGLKAVRAIIGDRQPLYPYIEFLK